MSRKKKQFITRRMRATVSVVLAVLMAAGPVLPSIDPFILFGALASSASTITWDGGGEDALWSNPLNWSEDRVPNADDIATFNGTEGDSAKDAVIDEDVSVAGIDIVNTYSSTIEVRSGKRITVGQEGFKQAGGSFKGSSAPVNIFGSFSLEGGTFTAPSNTLTVKGNWNIAGGTFEHNEGSVVLDGIEQLVFGSTGFYNFTKVAGIGQTLEFESGKTISTSGTLRLKGAAATPGGDDDENVLRIRASTNGEPVIFDPRGSVDAAYLDLQDVINTNAKTPVCHPGCTSSGNVSGWQIVAANEEALGSRVLREKSSVDFAADERVIFTIKPSSGEVAADIQPVEEVAEDLDTRVEEEGQGEGLLELLKAPFSALSKISAGVVPTVHAAVDEDVSSNILSAEVVTPGGDVSKDIIPVIETVDGETVIEVPKPNDHAFRPGKYILRVVLEEDVTIEQDFTWGVLAMNFNKSSYRISEDVKIGVAVLDDMGRTICDADLTLTVTSPDGTPHEVEVAGSETCGPTTVTNEPDYVAYFEPTMAGTYTALVVVETENGTRTMQRKFTVFASDASQPFVVERNAPTRIYPPADYPVEITITAQEDFSGSITEQLPPGFEIHDVSHNGRVEDVLAPAAPDGVGGEDPEVVQDASSEEVELAEEELEESLEETVSPSPIPSVSPSPTPTPTPEPSIEPSPTALPTVSPTPVATSTPTPSPVTTPSPDPLLENPPTEIQEPDIEELREEGEIVVKRNIVWDDITLEAGDSLTLTYAFKGPMVSPEFYLLGPLEFTVSDIPVWQEPHAWQIASDAFPTVSSSNTYSSTGSSTHSVSMPSGITAGDLLLVYFAARNDSGDNLTQSGGSDWTRLAQNRESTDFLQGAWFAKVAAGGDSLTIDSGNTAGDVAAVSMRITDHGVSNPATDITVSSDAEGTGNNPNPGTANPGVTDDYLWIEGSAGHGSVSTSATYWSTNYTGIGQLRSAASSAVVAGTAYRQLNASSEDPGTMTMTNDAGWVAHTLAIPPAAATGPTLSGTVYTDEGVTNIGADKTVRVAVNGTDHGTTDETDGSGAYSIADVVAEAGDVITVYLEDETEDAVAVTISDGEDLSSLNLYQDRLITRCDNSCSLTNANLSTAAVSAEDDISDIYSVASGDLTVEDDKELFVPTSHTFAPGDVINVHDIEIVGTLTLGSNNATVSGSWDAGSGTFTSSGTVTFAGSIAAPEATSEGPNSPTSGTNDSSFGTGGWFTPENITAEDGSTAFDETGGAHITYYLKATDYGFSIPSDATIDGIVVEAKKVALSAGVTDERARIIKGGTIGSTDKALVGNWNTSALTWYEYGGASDLWGESWTASDINASTFGFAISADVPSATNGQIDHIRITVHYTTAAGSSSETLTPGASSFNDLTIESVGGEEENLSGYWNLDETSAGTFADSSGNDNDLIGAGATGGNNTPQPTDEKPTLDFTNVKALDFDGTDDFAAVLDPAGEELDFGDTDDFTIAFWVRIEAAAGGFYVPVSKPADETGGPGSYAVYLDDIGNCPTASDGNYCVMFGGGDGTDDYTVLSSEAISTSSGWVHVVGVFDQDSAANTTIYINGVADEVSSVGTIGDIGSLANDGDFGIQLPLFAAFDGQMDDVRVYKRALSSSEVESLAAGESLASGDGTFTLGSNLDVNGDLNLVAGTLDTDSGNSYDITLAGDWNNTGGTFTANSSTVTLNGTAQAINGDTTFYDLSKTEGSNNSTDETVTFEVGSTQTISNTLTLDGIDNDDRINLVSSDPGTSFTLDVTSEDQNVSWLDVTDSEASNNDIRCSNCVNGGGNDDEDTTPFWVFVTEFAGTLTQNDWRWYADSDELDVTDPWGASGVAENTTLAVVPAQNNPPRQADELRLRVNITAGSENLDADLVEFKLQYAAATTCSGASYTDVGAGGSGTIWRYATSSVTDGTTIVTPRLTVSDVGGLYVKSAAPGTNPNSATVGQDIEYDFHIEQNGAADGTTYCFRVVESDDTALDTYSSYPALETGTNTSQILRHGDVFVDGVEKGATFAD